LKVSTSDSGPDHDPDQKVLDPYGNLVSRREFHRKWLDTDERDLKGWPGVEGRCPVCRGLYCKVSPARTYLACKKSWGELPVFDVSGKEVLYGLHPLDHEPAWVLEGKPLMPRHLQDLEASGLTEETIRKAGLYSEARREYVQRLLGWSSYPGTLGQVLVFPYHFPHERTLGDYELVDEDGRVTPVIRSATYHRLKPDHPRDRDDDDGVVKYEATKGQPNRAYFPPGTLPVLQDVSAPLILTEGEKKALAADQAGFPCVALAGVFSWQQRRPKDVKGNGRGPRRLLPDLEEFVAWKGRQVFVAFDSDREDNPNVMQAERYLARELAEPGAVVKIVKIPGEGGEKVGLDDYLIRHGADGLRALLAAAEDPGLIYANELEPPAAVTNSLRQAERFLEKNCRHADGSTLRYGNGGCLYQWDGVTYAEISEKDLRPRVHQSLKEEFLPYDRARLLRWEEEVRAYDRRDADDKAPKPGPKPVALDVTVPCVNNVVQSILSHEEVSFGPHVAPDTWIGEPPFPAEQVLVARNGLVDRRALLDGRTDGFLVPHTPRFFTTRKPLGFDVDPAAPEPEQWRTFLSQLWPDDPQSVAALQQFFGYCLTPDTRQQKAFLLIGPPRAGKGTIARLLTQLLGVDNVASTSFDSLGERFGLEEFFDKQLAVISDAHVPKFFEGNQVAVERFKKITGEDMISVDRKHLPKVSRRLPVRFLVLANELPALKEASGALARRFVTLQLKESFLDREDLGLEDRLLAELPGIFLWALEGKRLLERAGKFTQPDSGRPLARELKNTTSPVLTFVEENCELGPDLWTETSLLFQAWERWAKANGKPVGSQDAFLAELKAARHDLVRTRHRLEDRRRPWGYQGIGLLAPAAD
jgi:putative DNA primase/helicase